MNGAYVYLLQCADGSYYVGSTRGSVEMRIAQHQDGTLGGYTKSRRPVRLAKAEWFARITDAIAAERRLKGWGRAKKEAWANGDYDLLQALSRNRQND